MKITESQLRNMVKEQSRRPRVEVKPQLNDYDEPLRGLQAA